MPILEALVAAGVIPSQQSVVVTTLAGGYWNEVVRLDVGDGRRLVAKRLATGSDNPYFPIDPDLEAQATTLIAGSAIGTDPVAYLPDQRLLVTEYLEGEPWDGDVEMVGRLLRRVHAIPPVGLRPLQVGTRAVVEHAGRILDWGDARLDGPAPTVDHPGLGGTLVHTDCGPGNLIQTRHGLRLIDWQCPGSGDAVEDLACFASPAMQILYERRPLTSDETTRLLASYGDGATTERFHETRISYHWRIAAYCAARRARLAATDPVIAERYRAALTAETELIEQLR